MDTVRYILALVVWATIPPAFLFWFLIHPFHRYWRSLGPLPTYLVVVPACLLTMGALVRWNDPVAATDLGTHYGLFGAGVILWGLAVFMERRIRGQLDFRTLAGVPQLRQEEAPRLLQEGVYARVRHPRYISLFVGTVGWSLMANHGASYLVAALAAPAVVALVRLEERELLERFGEEYRDYMDRVPALLPRR